MILDDKEFIAKKIREYRISCGLTQAELAEKIDISTKQVSRIETADYYPSLCTFLKAVKVLNINVNDFFTVKPQDENKTRLRLIKLIYSANNTELEFYDRILTFANDEVQEVKKNMLIQKIR